MLNTFLKKENTPSAGHQLDAHSLNEWQPISRLPVRHQEEILSRSHTESLKAGTTLFEISDTDEKDFYLLNGMIELHDSRGKVIKTIRDSGEKKLQLIDNHHPRIYQAVVQSDSTVFVTRRTFFDTLNQSHESPQSPALEVDELDLEASGNWMLHILNSGAFSHLPPSRLQEVFLHMTSLDVSAGQTIIEEGSQQDAFYLLQQGEARLERDDHVLATLSNGDTFGEEGVIAQLPSPHRVRMVTDGHIMRMTRTGFESLIASHLLAAAPFKTQAELESTSQYLLDLRTDAQMLGDRYLRHDLITLRSELSKLDTNAEYLVLADTQALASLACYQLLTAGVQAAFAGSELMADLLTDLEPASLELPSDVDTEIANKMITSTPDVEMDQASELPLLTDNITDSAFEAQVSDSLKDIELQIRKEMNDLLIIKKRELEQEMATRFKQYHLITAKLIKKKLAEHAAVTAE